MESDAERLSKEVLDEVLDVIFAAREIEIDFIGLKEETFSLAEFLSRNQEDVIRTITFTANNNRTAELLHLRVLPQFVFNHCGFHMLHHIKSLVHLLRNRSSTTPNLLHSRPHFWSLYDSIGRFLVAYAAQKKLDSTKWPWNYRSLRYGELERMFLKLLLRNHPELIALKAPHEEIEVKVSKLNVQYARIIKKYSGLIRLSSALSEFARTSADPTDDKTRVFSLCVAATNHWCLLFAASRKGRLEIFFCDSLNRDCLKWGDEEIKEYIQQRREERIRTGKVPWSDYLAEANKQSLRDIILIVPLLVECLLGAAELAVIEAELLVKVIIAGLGELLILHMGRQPSIAELLQTFGRVDITSEEELLLHLVLPEFLMSYRSLLEDIELNAERRRRIPSIYLNLLRRLTA
eukprot:TRINITY_DN12810_c0_g3_i2.p1 TRINITY_DN12810_c0_g3~~TRINITY_DN12810_c0_g3_i2.p1  ORF type:complete len:406 (-),score=80.60 TRINITY_DN12810_c0_g3_i2:69-1286(-)